MPEESAEPINLEITSANNEMPNPDDEMLQTLTKLCHGDLYLIGRPWIKALKSLLVGAEFSLIPVVYAAKPIPPPEKPPLMKYTELPIYKAPHYEYKEYLAEKDKCPKANVKLVQEYLLPSVSNYRKSTQQSYKDAKSELGLAKKELCDAIGAKKREFKNFMRHPENLQMRQAVVALGAATGYYIGSGKGILRKLFFTSLGLLATGALCFPKETDEHFRNIAFYTAKFGIGLYNGMCGKSYTMREKLPSKADLPPPPKPRKMNPCPKK